MSAFLRQRWQAFLVLAVIAVAACLIASVTLGRAPIVRPGEKGWRKDVVSIALRASCADAKALLDPPVAVLATTEELESGMVGAYAASGEYRTFPMTCFTPLLPGEVDAAGLLEQWSRRREARLAVRDELILERDGELIAFAYQMRRSRSLVTTWYRVGANGSVVFEKRRLDDAMMAASRYERVTRVCVGIVIVAVLVGIVINARGGERG